MEEREAHTYENDWLQGPKEKFYDQFSMLLHEGRPSIKPEQKSIRKWEDEMKNQ